MNVTAPPIPAMPAIPPASLGELLRQSARARSSPDLPAIAIAVTAPRVRCAGTGADLQEWLKREIHEFCRQEALTAPEYMACAMVLYEAFGMPCTRADLSPR